MQDAVGNTVTTNTSSVTLALTTPAERTLACTANPSAVAGVATFAGCKVDKAGTYTLTATDGPLTAATSTSFAITVGSGAKLAFTAQPGGSTGGMALATQPMVTVQDAAGNTVTDEHSAVTLAIARTPAAATLALHRPTRWPRSPASRRSPAARSKPARQLHPHGHRRGRAHAGDEQRASTSPSAPPTKLAFTQQPGTGAGGTALATQPVVTVQDAGGNTVTTTPAR